MTMLRRRAAPPAKSESAVIVDKAAVPARRAVRKAVSRPQGAPKLVIPISAVPPTVSDETNNYAETIARYEAKIRNPMTAIRARCVQCCCGSLKEVATCNVSRCALHPFRMGENPFHLKTRKRLGLVDGETDEGSGDE